VSDSENQPDRKRCWTGIVYVLCLVSFVFLSGHAWRTWRFYTRGIERGGASEAEQRPGINVELAQYDPDALDAVLSDVASLGFYWLRQRFPWREMEPQPGVYDWARWDALVDAAQRHGLGMIATLDLAPAWATRHDPIPMPCVPPCDEVAYARFVSAFASRYGDFIDHYQVWDEPNLSRHWGGGHVAPCGYVIFLRAAYPAIHAADPTAWVLGGGLAPTQAPGPDNLNDWTYLRQVYAAGGGGYFDILAAKPYGFWSGPEDRRIAPDVLNFSRVVALREVMRAAGDSAKPVWAVEWGWNVRSPRWMGELPPWGSDTIAEQKPRILGAIARARTEWPWMGTMCWAAYQPGVPVTNPRWGFALRGNDGSVTLLYDVFRIKKSPLPAAARPPGIPAYWTLIWPLLAVAGVGLAVPWWCEDWRTACRWGWHRFASLPAVYHLGILLALAVLYALTPVPEWVLLEWALALLVFYVRPRWALTGATFSIPFLYLAKPVGNLQILPAETTLVLSAAAMAMRCVRMRRVHPHRLWGRDRGERAGTWKALDWAWGLWVIVGAFSLPVAPDRSLALREWRVCMLGPALLYALIRLEGVLSLSEGGPCRSGASLQKVLLTAWISSGVTVALVGVGQWLAGALIPAGSVGRVTGVYYSPNHMALYLERILPLAWTLAWCQDESRRWRLGVWGAAIVLTLGLYLTYSRGAWLLAMPVALLVVGSLCGHRFRWWIVGAAAAVLALVLWGVLCGRAISSLAEEIRIPVWQSTLAMIADHLWRGVGLDGFQFVYPRYMRVEAWTEPLLYHPHNMWLDVAVRLGIPGLTAFLFLVGACLGSVGRLRRGTFTWQKVVSLGLLASLGAALAHGMVDSGYFIGDLAWSLALVAGVARLPEGRA
jgi:hypothetical protein